MFAWVQVGRTTGILGDVTGVPPAAVPPSPGPGGYGVRSPGDIMGLGHPAGMEDE